MPRIRRLLVALFLFATPAMSACSVITGSDKYVMRLDVGPAQVDCVGAFPQKCLLVQENGSEEWTYFYDPIEGFDWQPGYEYTLLVAVRKIEHPMADGSSLEYRLVRILRKTYITPPPTA